MGESQGSPFSVLEILTCLLYNNTQNCEVLKIKTNSKLILKLTALFAVICLALCSCSVNINVNSSSLENKSTTPASGTLSVHYLDVGQGDSIFIELPNKKCMLIDAGENMYGKSITEYITNLGYSKIDYLVATHPHADHIGSMAYVVNHNDIGEIYMPKVATTTKTYEKLLTAISDKGLKVKSAKAGMNIVDDGDFSIDILAPVTIEEDDLNNCSIILKMNYKGDSFLFLGDAEKKELETVTADMSAEVLKVGHHGSRTSTTKALLEEVNPKYAVISLGKGNSYGHPHKSTLELLDEFNVETYRTDQDGTIVISTEGSGVTIKTGQTSMKRDE